MEKTNCNVVRDLLPLYADGVLSEDSRRLVEAHLPACPECTAYREKLTSADVFASAAQRAQEKSALKGLRRRLQARRLLTICMTAVIVLGIAAAAFYGLAIRQSYVPYEKSGISVEDGMLYIDRADYAYLSYEKPGETSLFLCCRASVLDNLRAKKTDSPYREAYVLLHDSQLQDVTQVYYLSQAAYDTLSHAKQPTSWEELKVNSVLIWEKP